MRSWRICQIIFLTESTSYRARLSTRADTCRLQDKSDSPAVQERKPTWHQKLSTNCIGPHNDQIVHRNSGRLHEKVAENSDILSSMEEGCRRGKGTARQLLIMQIVLGDAQLFWEDIHLMSVATTIAYSSMFNYIDHDKLLLAKRTLAFPEDSIEAVKDLCTDAETECTLPAGNTSWSILNEVTYREITLTSPIPHPYLTSSQMAASRQPGIPPELPERHQCQDWVSGHRQDQWLQSCSHWSDVWLVQWRVSWRISET